MSGETEAVILIAVIYTVYFSPVCVFECVSSVSIQTSYDDDNHANR